MRETLTQPQERALAKMTGDWQSAYELRESRTTLQALVRRGLVQSRNDVGAGFFPRSAIMYRKRP